MLANPKTYGALPSVAPRIQGPYRQIEELGELVHGEEAIVVVHLTIIEDDPVARVPYHSRSMVGRL